MKKRVVSIALIFAMLAMFLPAANGGVTAYAAEEEFVIQNGVLTKYNGSGGDVVIPEGVTEIGWRSFYGCDGLTGVTIPASVTLLDTAAFNNCANLQWIRVRSGNSVYSSQDGVVYSKDKKNLLLYPCGKSGEFIVPNFVETIGKTAFAYCQGITSIMIPDSVTTLEAGAFSYCSNLGKAIIAASVVEVVNKTFYACNNLKTVYYRGRMAQWSELEGKMGFSYGVKSYANYKSVVPLTFLQQPSSVIAEKGESVSFAVKAEGEGILTYQWYYKKAGEDSWSVWKGRTNWYEKVTPNDSWNGIQLFCKVRDSSGSCLRSDVVMLIIIDDEEIMEESTDKCGDNLKWNLNKSTGTLTITGSGDMWDYYYEGFLLPPWCIDYDEFEFTADKVKKVVFSGDITSIGDSAFALCSNLSGITIPNTVKSIGNQAFAGTGLTTFNIPASVTDFGYDVFSDGIIPIDEETYLGGVSKMTSITVSSGSKTYSSDGGVLFNKAKTELVCYPTAKAGTYSIPSSVQTVGNMAFSGCERLTGVTIPTSVRTIGADAFSYCTGLCSVTIPEGVVVINECAFLDAELDSIWLPKSVQSIGYLALNNTDENMENILPIKDIYYAGSRIAWNGLKTTGETDEDFSFRDYLREAILHFGEESTEITSQPQSRCITVGDSLSLSVEAKGKGLTYQWYFRKPGQNGWSMWNNRTKATETVIPGESWDGIRLYCEVKDSDGNAVKSDTATITVKCPSINITRQPDDQSFVSGKPVTFSLNAEGSRLQYQWYYKKTGQTSWSKWNSRIHASETVTPNDTWNGMSVRCLITDAAGKQVYSDTATFAVAVPAIKIVTQPVSQSVTLGGSIKLTVKAEGEGLTYQWYFKKAGQTGFTKWNNRTHASETVTPNATWNGIQLYCEIKDGAGNTVKSNTATITVTEPKIRITTQPVDQTVVLGDTIQLSVKAEGEALTYQWYFKKAGQTSFSKWNNRTHASETVTPNATWNGIQLYCEIKDSAGNSVKSSTATITVTEPKIRITTQPVDQTVVLGDTIQLSVKAEGQALTYQWYFKKAGQTSFSKWNGRTRTSETVTPNATWNGIQLYCEIKDGAGNSVRSDTVTVTFR